MKCVGLTDAPKSICKNHGSPEDWWQTPFKSERDAKFWKRDMLTVSGYKADPKGNGGRYGYTFTA